MKTFRLVLFTLAAANCFAQVEPQYQKDAAGSKDHPLTKRFEGSVILRQTSKKFTGFTIPLERVVFDYGAQAFKPFNKLKPEGALTTSFYRLPRDVSTLECIRAYQSELAKNGFEVLFEGDSGGSATGESNSLDNGYGRFLAQVYQTEKDFGLQQYTLPGCDDFRFIALKKPGGDGAGDVYVTVFCGAVTGSWKAPEKGIETGTVIARVDVLEEKPRSDRMVLVKAPEMENQITSTGRVALYGILFDFNKDTVKPESDPTLEQISALLKSEPSLRLLVVGHTDNVGEFEFNRELSTRRANAIVQVLVSRFGVDKSRLFPFGCSFASPAAPNTSEEGRAKNRRVELVRWN
ncbi:MAG: OmpA family protein [Verrucomicrobiaceae bacterium]|nr:MAG: OmpA family protein [Verrucomicrobiaceae bacterium]